MSERNTGKKKKHFGKIVLMLIIILIPFSFGLVVGRTGNYISYTPNFLLNIFNNDSDDNTIVDGQPIIDLQPIPDFAGTGYTTESIYEKVTPSIVEITVYEGNDLSPISSGTGIVMSEDGYIITNAHVLEGGTGVNVEFYNSQQASATIIGSDELTDIAVIKVEGVELEPAEFGSSDDLKVGQTAIVIGNPGGLSNTLTQGVISGLNREIDDNSRSIELIQVDAAVNPGNSGGPLFNSYGQVVGITSSKIADIDFEGIGFAIPINEAIPIIQSLIENGFVADRAVLGVTVFELNETNGPMNNLPSSGIFINSIDETSDLNNKGILEGDVIIKANGVEILTTNDLIDELDKYKPGDLFPLEIYRSSTGETIAVEVILSQQEP